MKIGMKGNQILRTKTTIIRGDNKMKDKSRNPFMYTEFKRVENSCSKENFISKYNEVQVKLERREIESTDKRANKLVFHSVFLTKLKKTYLQI